jgi:glycerol uptake facilitator-like aquaporin
MTFMFLVVILGTTHKRAPAGFAGLAIGLALTLIHLISIPVTNTSVNPRAVLQPRCSLETGLFSSSGCSGWLP